MGKQSKRKNKRRGGGGGGNNKHHHNPTGLASDPLSDGGVGVGGGGTNITSETKNNNDGQSQCTKIIQKIRHGDPRIRHASLVALSRTLYDGGALESAALSSSSSAAAAAAANKKSNTSTAEANNPILLRALSERILDSDIPCAITAVGCLSNYVSFYCGGTAAVAADETASFGDDKKEEEEDVASIVMVPILLQRLQLSIAALRSLESQLMEEPRANSAKNKESHKGKKKSDNKKQQAGVSFKGDDNAVKQLYLRQNEQYTLLSLSLLTLSGIIENCGVAALQSCGGNAFVQLVSVLNVGCASIQQHAACADNKERDIEPMLDTVTNASRALHSLLDDNTALIASLPLGGVGNEAAAVVSASPSLTAAVSQLTNALIMNTNIPTMARLHASGSILALRRVLVLEKEYQQLEGNGGLVSTTHDEKQIVSTLQTCTNEVIIPYLSSIFDSSFTASNHDDATAKQLLQEMIDTSNQLSTMKNDESMEAQILSKVNSRKESARSIARRQKKMKEEKQEEEEGVQMLMEEENDKQSGSKVGNDSEKKSDDAAAMVVEDEMDTVDEESKKQEKEDELQVKLDSIVSKWKDIVVSHKLALELVANLCSPLNNDDAEGEEEGMYNEDDDDDDEHMWDSDDEAKLIADAAEGQGMTKESTGVTVTPCEQATYMSMTNGQCNMPMKILSFFRKWAEFIPSTRDDASDTTMDSKTSAKVPALVSQDMDELLSTCALCLSNVVACNLVKEKSSLDLFWKDLASTLKLNYHHHVTSVILSLVRNEQQARTLVDSLTLECLTAILQQRHSNDESVTAEAMLQTHSNIISILGVLCSEPHPAIVNTQVCQALLERLRSSSSSEADTGSTNMKHSIIITHEILNVLMDMYGNDDDEDCHNQVFKNEDVLGHFQRCIPGFKRSIKKVAASTHRGMGSMREEMEVDLWNETALNATRFVKYKKGG